jgi:hypothetical protein
MAKRSSGTEFAPLADGEKLASEKDDYCIVAQSFAPAYLYVFQVDSSGKKEWLFPKNESSSLSSGSNPVSAGETITVPDADSKRSLFLDKTIGVEHIYAVVSATQWPELENALARPALASAATTVRQPNRLALRGVGGARVTDASQPVESTGTVLVVERWFNHAAE